MKEEITIIEDYKRRLVTVNEELKKLQDDRKEEDIETCRRLAVKAGCYRTIITELESELKHYISKDKVHEIIAKSITAGYCGHGNKSDLQLIHDDVKRGLSKEYGL
jgi:ribosome maturation protein Sdo1